MVTQVWCFPTPNLAIKGGSDGLMPNLDQEKTLKTGESDISSKEDKSIEFLFTSNGYKETKIKMQYHVQFLQRKWYT